MLQTISSLNKWNVLIEHCLLSRKPSRVGQTTIRSQRAWLTLLEKLQTAGSASRLKGLPRWGFLDGHPSSKAENRLAMLVIS
ncbi:MAG: hypothetical protein DLM53_09965 [Candidatus Eremiobacter antarcticus]|nr:MAG: hypothetical protein DLM53_09965 [Candidatus Eremiobacter sp. RRmetagenome_bin22]